MNTPIVKFLVFLVTAAAGVVASALPQSGNDSAYQCRAKPGAIALYKKATILEDRGEIGKAFTHYNEAVRIDPSFCDAKYRIGKLFEKRGKLNDALKWYRYALAANDKFPEVLLAAAEISVILNSTEMALDYYEKLLALDRRNPVVYMSLGRVYHRKGYYNNAVYYFRAAMKLYPPDSPGRTEARRMTGMCFYDLGKCDSVIVYLDIRGSIDDEQARTACSDCYRKLKIPEARRYRAEKW
jgi:tetratricopeptide (TPR) repeat protein